MTETLVAVDEGVVPSVRDVEVPKTGHRIVGIISSRDLMAASLSKMMDFDRQQRRSFMHSVDVVEVMTRELVTVEPGATLREAAAKAALEEQTPRAPQPIRKSWTAPDGSRRVRVYRRGCPGLNGKG